MHHWYEENLKYLELYSKNINLLFKESDLSEIDKLDLVMKRRYKEMNKETLEKLDNITGAGYKIISEIVKSMEVTNLEVEKYNKVIELFDEFIGVNVFCGCNDGDDNYLDLSDDEYKTYRKLLNRPAYIDVDKIRKVENSMALKVAAKWWRDNIERAVFDFDDESSYMSRLKVIWSSLNLKDKDIKSEQFDEFADAIYEKMKEFFIKDERIIISSGTNPSYIFRFAWKDSKLRDIYFSGISMLVTSDEVLVNRDDHIYITKECAKNRLKKEEKKIKDYNMDNPDYFYIDNEKERKESLDRWKSQYYKKIKQYEEYIKCNGYNMYEEELKDYELEECEFIKSDLE